MESDRKCMNRASLLIAVSFGKVANSFGRPNPVLNARKMSDKEWTDFQPLGSADTQSGLNYEPGAASGRLFLVMQKSLTCSSYWRRISVTVG